MSAPTSGTGNDFEQLGYDADGNVTSRRLRDGATIGYGYDAPGAKRSLTSTATRKT